MSGWKRFVSLLAVAVLTLTLTLGLAEGENLMVKEETVKFSDSANQAITFSETNVTVAKGKSATVTATASDSSLGKPKKTTWETGDKSVATVKNGKVTGKAAGATTITCTMTWKDGTELTGSFAVTVTQPVTSVKLTSKKVTVKQGSTVQLEVTIAPENATNPELEWTSSDSGIATVDGSGNVTGISAGKCTITGTAKDGSGKKASATVTVTPKYMLSVTKCTMKITGNKLHAEFRLKNAGKVKITSAKILAFFYDASGNQQTFKVDGSSYSYFMLTCSDSVKAGKNLDVTLECTGDFGDSCQMMVAIATYTDANGESTVIPHIDRQFVQGIVKGATIEAVGEPAEITVDP